MSGLQVSGLSYAAQGKALVNEASFALEPGTLTMLVGPNGAGKTTLLKLALGLLRPDAGEARIDGQDIAELSPIIRARKIAYLPQQRPLAWPQPVRDIVALGRFAFGGVPSQLSGEDEEAVARAISTCDLGGLEERAVDSLSGGELARVHLARALASEAPMLIADEPVAALDPRFQHEILGHFSKTAREGRGVLTVIHDLSLAAQYADRIIWMNNGKIVADGRPADTITPANLRAIFGVEASVEIRPAGRVAVEISGPAKSQ
jgi:iron complex transport system ATP-binding protein